MSLKRSRSISPTANCPELAEQSSINAFNCSLKFSLLGSPVSVSSFANRQSCCSMRLRCVISSVSIMMPPTWLSSPNHGRTSQRMMFSEPSARTKRSSGDLSVAPARMRWCFAFQ